MRTVSEQAVNDDDERMTAWCTGYRHAGIGTPVETGSHSGQRSSGFTAEELRQAITLREMEGMSYEEIAEYMACRSHRAIRIFRAREAIAANCGRSSAPG